MKYQFKVKPYRIQLESVKRAIKTDGGFAFFTEPGCGKTKAALDFCGIMHYKVGLRKVLIACPLSVAGVWEDQIEEHLPDDIPRTVNRITKGDKVKKLRNIKDNKGINFIIMSYDSVWRDKVNERLLRWVEGSCSCVIADESHYIKNTESKRSKGMHKLGKVARYRLALSGTPINNSPLDVFSQYKFLDDSVFGTKWRQFKFRYAVFGGYGGFQIMRYKNLKELSKKFHSIAFRAKKEDVEDLPQELHQKIPIELDSLAKKMYNEMARQMYFEIIEMEKEVTASILLTKMLRLHQIVGGFVKTEEGDYIETGGDKLRALSELLESYAIEGQQKMVIYLAFRPELEAVYNLCQKKKLNPLWIAGGQTGEDRDRIIKAFQREDKFKVLVSTIASGGIGIDLTAANVGLFYSLTYKWDHYYQAMSRIHRTGLKHNVLFLYLLGKGTIDEDIYNSLKNKENLAHTITDKWKELFSKNI